MEKLPQETKLLQTLQNSMLRTIYDLNISQHVNMKKMRVSIKMMSVKGAYIKYARRPGGRGGSPKCVQISAWGEGGLQHCVQTHKRTRNEDHVSQIS